MKGKVYIASMNMLGKGGNWADPINKDSKKINVTSFQQKNSPDRLIFSPMTQINNGYKGYFNFESYWQSGKVYQDIPHTKTKQWWKEVKSPKRRYPNSKGKKVLYAIFDGSDEKMDYITSRKKIYVPEYYNLIKNTSRVKYWKSLLNNGTDLTVYDFDGPRENTGEVSCLEMNKQTLITKINDTTFPFGHGYVVAATLLGIEPKEYTIS